MDKIHKHILKVLRRSIIQDMDVNNGILQPLRAEYILRDEDIVTIQSGASREQKAEILIDILPSRGPYAFDVFRQATRHHYEWISENMDNLEENAKSFNDLTYVGTPILPPLSPLTVIREEKITQLKRALEAVQPNGYVALHGMKGFGKSCLTASTLKDTKLVRHLFYNEVYWIKFGCERPIDEEVLIQLNRLYHLVKNLEIPPAALNSEPLKDSLIHFLKCHFSKENHCHALLILDDVCNEKIIQVFDFQCKTLVITADIDVLWEKRPIVIEMNEGFTEAESLGLFAKVLDTDIDKLPIEAKLIHEECKGMPLLIAMFSAQFEEFKYDMRLRSDRWRYYLNALRNKDESNKVIRQFLVKQEAIFHICIEQLPPEMKRRYAELVIFSEDVNIMPQTLEILWEGYPFQVEEMMLELCHKSLAAKQWNDELHSYIYGVHDLLICHLRRKISKSDLVDMHKSLIAKYRKYCNGDFSKLPRDNYSHSYIGHHLEQAQLYNYFPSLYLDLDFIQSVIVNSGLSNLLIDIDNYRQYITQNYDPDYDMHVRDLERFLEEQAGIIAEHRRKKCLDIIQIAMNHPYQGYVNDVATKLATERSQYLYILHDKKFGHINVLCSEELSTVACTSCFVQDPNLILIGNNSGEIFLWDSIYRKQKIFNGHSKTAIKKIMMSPEGGGFLALADNGIMKFFKLSNDNHLEEHHRIPPQTPRQKQDFWNGIFTSKILQDDSLTVFTVTGEVILDMTFGFGDCYIAACTNRGTIRVWDYQGNVISDYTHNPHNSSYLKNIAFTMQGNLLHVMDETRGVLISYGRTGTEYCYISQYNPDLRGKGIVFFRDVPDRTNSLFVVTEDKAVYIKWFRSYGDQLHSYTKQVRAYVENDKTTYICAALTEDGQYLILADSAGFVNIWNTDVGYQPVATYKNRVSSLDTYWAKEDGYHVICGTENRVLHRWKLPIEEVHTTIKKPLFDAAVQKFVEADTVAVETSSNTVVALHDSQIVAESEPLSTKIMHLTISSDGKKVAYVTDQSVVYLMDVKMKKIMKILKLPRIIEFVKILSIQNNDIVVCRETDDNLKVWQNAKVTYLVENAGYVIAIHKAHEECVITITLNGFVTVWNINGTAWLQMDNVVIDAADVITTFSCLSNKKNYLAVLYQTGHAVLYKLQEDTSTLPVCTILVENFRKTFPNALTCCDISQDEQYLAVAFENGDISIIDILSGVEIHKLRFHSTSVSQLYWAPSIIGDQILLSVNADELVWWKVSLAPYYGKHRRSIRMPPRSISTPSISTISNVAKSLPVSQSVDSNVCNIQQKEDGGDAATNESHGLSKYFANKTGKDPTQPHLLAVVELPSNFLAKVCVAPDFTKFLTVDIYGGISTFSLLGYK